MKELKLANFSFFIKSFKMARSLLIRDICQNYVTGFTVLIIHTIHIFISSSLYYIYPYIFLVFTVKIGTHGQGLYSHRYRLLNRKTSIFRKSKKSWQMILPSNSLTEIFKVVICFTVSGSFTIAFLNSIIN